MINFSEERFPTDISFGASGGPEYSTTVVTTASGREYRNINWLAARARYNISHGIKNGEQLSRLIEFFRTKKGKAIGFRFKDWLDYKASNQQIGVGNGETTKFQLIKSYQNADLNEKRLIHKPVKDTIKVYKNNKLSNEVEINYTNGVVTFLKPPKKGEIITASFEFDVPVRFDVDYLDIKLENNNFYNWQDINLIEVKL